MRKDYEKMFIKTVLTANHGTNSQNMGHTRARIPRKMYDDANHYLVKNKDVT